MSNLSHLLNTNLESSSSITTILSYLAIILAILVITSRNPVISLLYLIGLFVDIAIYLISLNLTYLGLSYITVYVGAISMLFIFVIMMINIQIVETSFNKNYFIKSIPLSIIIGILFIYPLYKVIPKELNSLYNNLNTNELGKQITKITLTTWEDKLFNPTIVESLGTVIYTNYSIWLLIISLILILAIIGAISIATPKQHN
nr:NADH dehydrogenase subunit 6 [Pneumocystis sp. 'ludovicianus']